MKRLKNKSATSINRFLQKNFNFNTSQSDTSVNKRDDIEIPSIHKKVIGYGDISKDDSNKLNRPTKSRSRLNLIKTCIKKQRIKLMSPQNEINSVKCGENTESIINMNVDEIISSLSDSNSYDQQKFVPSCAQLIDMINQTKEDVKLSILKSMKSNDDKLKNLLDASENLNENTKNFMMTAQACTKKFTYKKLTNIHLLIIFTICLLVPAAIIFHSNGSK
jgi:hypothetical protein